MYSFIDGLVQGHSLLYQVASLAIFLVTIFLIITEYFHRTIAAMLGAMLTVGLGLIHHESVFEYIDFETILVVIGLSILVEVLMKARVLQFAGLSILRASGGSPLKLYVYLFLMGVLLSAVVDEVTAVVVLGSLVISLSTVMGTAELKNLLFVVTIAANVGTMFFIISALPNIMIASAFNLGFLEFAANIMPLGLLITALAIAVDWRLNRGSFARMDTSGYSGIDPWDAVEDRGLFYKGLALLVATILSFFLQDHIGLSVGIIAMMWAVVGMVLVGEEPEAVLREAHWSTVFYFAGLFIVIAGLESSGVLEGLARAIHAAGSSYVLLLTVKYWLTAALSAVVDNIPITTLMISLVRDLHEVAALGEAELKIMLWGLVAATNLGGMLTPIGSPPNIIALGLFERLGVKVEFSEFIKRVSVVGLSALMVGFIYILLRSLLKA